MDTKSFIPFVKEAAKNKFVKTFVNPINDIVDNSLISVSTFLGAFLIKSVSGKINRSIEFTVVSGYGSRGGNKWMEEALYHLIYKYNDLSNYSKLVFRESSRLKTEQNTTYYSLQPGTHFLRYRNYRIVLHIIPADTSQLDRRTDRSATKYIIFTSNIGKNFITDFENDMREFRNKRFDLQPESPNIPIYEDYIDEDDGEVYLKQLPSVNKRKFDTLYLPEEVLEKLRYTLNKFMESKEEYQKAGIPWNLKILLHGIPGTGKTSLARIIASEWNRTLVNISGGTGGKFIPKAIHEVKLFQNVIDPLIVVSDMDKYPYLINEADVDVNSNDDKAESKASKKELFRKMINALDGIGSGEGMIIIIDTNQIDKFSPTLLRPGRIDLILEIPAVQPEVFRRYIYDIYHKELPKNIKLKRDNIIIPEIRFDYFFAKMSFDEICKKYLK